MALKTLYSCGLRVSECSPIQVSDIDSERMVVIVSNGKGDKERLVPLPERTLELLRIYWAEDLPRHWLFPGHEPDKHIRDRNLQRAFKSVVLKSGIQKKASVHSLRHNADSRIMPTLHIEH